jgi:phage protein U
MRASGEPQMLIRGDGAALGWFFVDHVHEQSEYLSASGVGNQINVTIDLVKSPDAASAESMLSMLMGLFE